NLSLLIDNPRVSGNASLFKTLSATPMFSVSPPALNNIVINRLFSNDLLGTGSGFKLLSNFNYLEAPILYIGLITLLLAPQAFLFYAKRKRNIYLILTAVCLVPLVFIYFRMMFWLFAADYYRSYTFFLSLLILFFALRALTFIDKTSVVHVKTLIATLFILLFMLYHNFSGNPVSQVDKHLRDIVAIFLVVYTGLIYLLGNKKIKLYALAGIGLCLCIELASFSSTTVNKRVVMTSEDLHNRKGYNDSSIEALAYIKAKDAGFYRIAKDYYSDAAQYICLNDPQIQGYKGTTEYAEWNQFNYVRFLSEMHVPNYADPIYAKWLYGFTNRFMLNTVTSVKYLLSKQNSRYFKSIGFDSLTTYGNVSVMRNKYFLPLGYTYGKYISFPEFKKLPNDIEKDQMLLNACVPEDTNITVFKDMHETVAKDSLKPLTFEEYKTCTAELKKDSLTITHFDDNNIIGTIKTDEKKLLFLSIPFDKGWKAIVDGKLATTYRVNIGFTGLMLDKGLHNIELHYVVPYLAAGAYTSAAALLIYLLAFIRFRKNKF
ncbi:MAG TPA: YfhO family protein, partial [Bacteroidia bacterium]|nr:YfhO family protein [Bacteroidia bacterium]